MANTSGKKSYIGMNATPLEGAAKRPKPPLLRAQLGRRYFWSLTTGRVILAAILTLLLLGSAWAVWQAEYLAKHDLGALTYVGNVGLALSGVMLGIAVAPAPAIADHSEQAALAVDEIAELSRSVTALIDDLGDLILSGKLDDATVVRLAGTQKELYRQRYQYSREIARWDRVAPGTADAIADQRRAADAILRKLDEGWEG